MIKFSDRFRQDAVFFGILFLVVLLRYYILNGFAFRIYDSDQSIMWNAAIDYSRGIFHEPRFYGQSYSSMMEALLAAPLIWFSVPVFYALPVITSILALFPFLLIALCVRSKGKMMEACLILSIPLFLPVEYGFLTTLSRGFVPGIFIASIGAIMIYSPTAKWGWFVAGLFSVLAFSVNPNSLLISIPVLLYLWIKNIKTKRFYLNSGLGVIIGLVVHFLAALFYILHPNYILHKHPPIIFGITFFNDAIHQLNHHLGNVTPVFGMAGIMSLVIFLIIATLLIYRKKNIEAIVVLSSCVLILLSLGTNQIFIGTESIFYSYSRMYLAVPVMISLFIPFLEIPFRRYGFLLLMIVVGLFIARCQDIKPAYNRVLAPGINHIVSVARPEVFRIKCEQVRDLARKCNITLVVEENDYFYDFINYGCATCFNDFPATLRPGYERRTWRMFEEEKKVHTNIMVIDFSFRLGNKLNKLDEPGIRYFNIQGYYFILGNKMPTLQLLKTLSINIRSF